MQNGKILCVHGLEELILLKCPRASLVAQLLRIHLQCRRPGFNPSVGKILWRRKKSLYPLQYSGQENWSQRAGYDMPANLENTAVAIEY